MSLPNKFDYEYHIIVVLYAIDETDISYSCNNAAALSCSYAVWILHVGEVCDDGGIWRAGISILSA